MTSSFQSYFAESESVDMDNVPVSKMMRLGAPCSLDQACHWGSFVSVPLGFPVFAKLAQYVIIALEMPDDAKIYTTDGHFDLICSALGKQVFLESMRYSF